MQTHRCTCLIWPEPTTVNLTLNTGFSQRLPPFELLLLFSQEGRAHQTHLRIVLAIVLLMPLAKGTSLPPLPPPLHSRHPYLEHNSKTVSNIVKLAGSLQYKEKLSQTTDDLF